MATIDLKQLAARESEQVEWKQNVARIEDVLETICAFANDFQNLGGGYVVCGAEETKDVHGFQDITYVGLTANRFKEVEGKVIADARNKISPSIIPLVEELPSQSADRRVLVFIVPASGQAHSYRADGSDAARYYVRSSRETVEARNGVLRELLVMKGALPPWDRRLNERAQISDIDLLTFREFMQEIGAWDPSRSVDNYFSESYRLSEFVPPLGGTRPLDGAIRPRNYSLLLFAKSPTEYFEGAHTVFSVYPGKDRSEPTAERTLITGSVITQTRKALDLLRSHQTTAFDKEDSTPNILKYPTRALQEAVVNALVHRDYESSEPVRITVFVDRVEIRSPGSLPRSVPQDKFKAGKAAPFWRNQSLAYFFNKLQLAQAEGQGIPTILRTMKELGSTTPSFELESDAVVCILPAHPRHEMLRQLAEVEKDLVLGKSDRAHERLTTILQTSPRHPKALELLAQSAKLRGRPDEVEQFVKKHSIRPSELEAGAVYQLAQVLLESPSRDTQELARRWFEYASTQKLQTDEVKEVALGLRKLGKNEDAIKLISTHLESGLVGPTTSALYDIRAKARIDLAKQCMATARRRDVHRQLKGRAWKECRDYLDLAEQDINRALELVTSYTQREFIQRDLDFVRNMQKQAERPATPVRRRSHH